MSIGSLHLDWHGDEVLVVYCDEQGQQTKVANVPIDGRGMPDLDRLEVHVEGALGLWGASLLANLAEQVKGALHAEDMLVAAGLDRGEMH